MQLLFLCLFLDIIAHVNIDGGIHFHNLWTGWVCSLRLPNQEHYVCAELCRCLLGPGLMTIGTCRPIDKKVCDRETFFWNKLLFLEKVCGFLEKQKMGLDLLKSNMVSGTALINFDIIVQILQFPPHIGCLRI